jgi:hypothetical protein
MWCQKPRLTIAGNNNSEQIITNKRIPFYSIDYILKNEIKSSMYMM